jgi:DNA-binding Xre family transcriptional regulator
VVQYTTIGDTIFTASGVFSCTDVPERAISNWGEGLASFVLSGVRRPAYTLLYTTTTEREGSVLRIRLTLEAALQHADMSGRELERRSGVHRDTIGKYRHNAARIVSLDILERFCDALGCTFTAMLAVEPDATRPSERPPTAPTPQGKRRTIAELEYELARREGWM